MDYFIAGNVTITKPDGAQIINSFTKLCAKDHIPQTIALARRELALYLEQHDLLFGCIIGALEVRTGPNDRTFRAPDQ